MPPRSALLLVDFQRDFLADDGRMPISRNQVEPLIIHANLAISAAREQGVHIVAIGNEFPPDDWFVSRGPGIVDGKICRRPQATDIALVIEVSSTTRRKDDARAKLYACARRSSYTARQNVTSTAVGGLTFATDFLFQPAQT